MTAREDKLDAVARDHLDDRYLNAVPGRSLSSSDDGQEATMTDHEITMSAPHPRGREVFCSCGQTFVAATSTAALLAQMDHREGEVSRA